MRKNENYMQLIWDDAKKKVKKAPILLKTLKFSHGLGIVWFQHFASLLNEQNNNIKMGFKGLKAKFWERGLEKK